MCIILVERNKYETFKVSLRSNCSIHYALFNIVCYIPSLEQFEQIVLYFETSEEMPNNGQVYRFIAMLAEREILQRVKALLVGIPKTQFLGRLPPEGREHYRLLQKEAIKQALLDYNCQVPVVFDLNFGHTDPQLILPNGSQITLDSITHSITFF
ncbi:MAG TPA: hypothetical protein VHA52_01425 [Candidatus Babeliaceae bacterium]|nr:hypothetical protein [Candidatus Babeliaceae bacterium]